MQRTHERESLSGHWKSIKLENIKIPKRYLKQPWLWMQQKIIKQLQQITTIYHTSHPFFQRNKLVKLSEANCGMFSFLKPQRFIYIQYWKERNRFQVNPQTMHWQLMTKECSWQSIQEKVQRKQSIIDLARSLARSHSFGKVGSNLEFELKKILTTFFSWLFLLCGSVGLSIHILLTFNRMYGPALTLGLIFCWVTAATTYINWHERQQKRSLRDKNVVNSTGYRKRRIANAERRSA